MSLHAPAPSADLSAAADKDQPLREDIRLLGRLLGDTVREQEGGEAFTAVETIRQIAVRFARDQEPAARDELAAILNGLPRDAMLSVVRAFTYFLHFANIAEDQHHIRRRRTHEIAGSEAREGSLAYALERLAEAGVGGEALAEALGHALVSPVLTAHPTEVSRKSILHCQREVARLLDTRDRVAMTPEEAADNDAALRAAVLTLWRTRMLRPNRLAVVDEVKNGISYYDDTFFAELPRLYCQFEDQLKSRFPEQSWDLPNFFRIGSWIGGDRDGNPFVTADILKEALRLQSSAALDFYLDEIHALGADLPLSQMLLPVSAELAALADRSPDRSPHRADEAYRRAL